MQTITFHSYKGGTGRTLLAASLALLAARRGKRVLALDFDLHAPSLPDKLVPERSPDGPGLVGWLSQAFAGTDPGPLAGYITDVALHEPLLPGGWLGLMPAGGDPSPDYFDELRRLRLQHRLDWGSAVDDLMDLQQRIELDLGVDYLLVDAGAGITATSSVATHVLADAVVLLTLDTSEQLRGARTVLDGLASLTSVRTQEHVALHVVLARVAAPGDDGHDGRPHALTPPEREQVERARAHLTEPVQPGDATPRIAGLHLLHEDPALVRHEAASLPGRGQGQPTVLHHDHMSVARALFGSVVEEQAG